MLSSKKRTIIVIVSILFLFSLTFIDVIIGKIDMVTTKDLRPYFFDNIDTFEALAELMETEPDPLAIQYGFNVRIQRLFFITPDVSIEMKTYVKKLYWGCRITLFSNFDNAITFHAYRQSIIYTTKTESQLKERYGWYEKLADNWYYDYDDNPHHW